MTEHTGEDEKLPHQGENIMELEMNKLIEGGQNKTETCYDPVGDSMRTPCEHHQN